MLRKLIALLPIAMLVFAFLQPIFAQETNKEEAKPQATPGGKNTVAFLNSMEVLNDKRKLGIGDTVSLRIVEDEDTAPHNLSITDSGEMEVPYIGRVDASGKTCKQLAYEIKNVLEHQYYYKATVIIGLDAAGGRTASRGRLYVMGQVRYEGAQDIPADEVYTVSKAILRAGGFGPYANKRKVKLMRPIKGGNGKKDSETMYVDLVKVLDEGQTSKDVIVEPEDVIVVGEKLVNIF